MNAFECFRMFPSLGENGLYTIIVDVPTSLSLALQNLQVILCGFIALALIACNLVVIVLFRKQMKKVDHVKSANPEAVKKRKQSEKVLAILAGFECVFNSLAIIEFIVCYTIFYYYTFPYCEDALMVPLVNGIWEVILLADFYIVLAVSRGFREMIFKNVPFFNWLYISSTDSKSSQTGSTVKVGPAAVTSVVPVAN